MSVNFPRHNENNFHYPLENSSYLEKKDEEIEDLIFSFHRFVRITQQAEPDEIEDLTHAFRRFLKLTQTEEDAPLIKFVSEKQNSQNPDTINNCLEILYEKQ